MMEVVLNEEFILNCPDSFHVMDEAEKKALKILSSRAALKEENIPVWEEMIGSLRKK